jgi:hypothetical protein
VLTRGLAPAVIAAALAACSRSPDAAAPQAPPAAPAAAPGSDSDAFRDVAAPSGVDFVHVLADGALDSLPESVGAGVTCLDYDGDGRMDLYFVAQAWNPDIHEGEAPGTRIRNRLYRNLGGGSFRDVTDRAGVGITEFGFMAVAADLDDDGRTDLFVTGHEGNHLLRNRGDGSFEDVTRRAGVGRGGCGVGAAAFDADGDGLLDLYVGRYVDFDKTYRLHYRPVVFPGPLAFPALPDILYLNNGDGTFSDATGKSGIGDVEPGRAMGASVLDYDLDGRPDLYVANDATASFLFHNEGGGKFRETGLAAGVAFGVQGDAMAAMAGAVGDVNEDGRPDMRVSAVTYGSLFIGTPQGFADRILSCGIAGAVGQWPSWGGGFLDFDDDGHLDLYSANGDLYRPTGRPDLLFQGRGDGTFEDASRAAGAWFREERPARGACIADLDDDARLDVVVTHLGQGPAILRNRTATGHGVLIALRPKPRTASGQGARVTVRAGGKDRVQTAWPRQAYLGTGDPRLHFGLGPAERVERVVVEWTDGTRQEFADLAVDRVWTIVQGGTIQ